MTPKPPYPRANAAEDIQLVIRCHGRRVAAVAVGKHAVTVLLAPSRRELILDGDLFGGRARRHVDCVNCPAGHTLDGPRLREVIALRCRRGRVASEDISRVEAVRD